MTDFPAFKRMNFFTGFFTTAQDWTDGQSYYLEKHKLHNRGLHTPGVIDGLEVIAAGGLKVWVQTGAALDGKGNDISLPLPVTVDVQVPGKLPSTVYVAIRYSEVPTDLVENVETPQYNGYTRIAEIPVLRATEQKPDNETWIELARIRLKQGVMVANAKDPDAPDDDEIDLRHVVHAGSVGLTEPGLSAAVLTRIVGVMLDKRRDFAALAGRFPVPSADDVRHAALTVEILARIGALPPEDSASVMAAIAAAEQDVAQDIAKVYPGLIGFPQYAAYRDAADTLWTMLQEGASLDLLLTQQASVSEAARELSEIVLQAPVANPGSGQKVAAVDGKATVLLDASKSQAFGGLGVARYHWRLSPLADAGSDRTVAAVGGEATVELDASGSQAFGEIVARYRWDRKSGG